MTGQRVQLLPIHGGEPISLQKVTNVVGRDPMIADVCIQQSELADAHCEIVNSGGSLLVRALAENGIRVNGQQVKEHELSEGDILGLGGLEFKVQLGTDDDADFALGPATQSTESMAQFIEQESWRLDAAADAKEAGSDAQPDKPDVGVQPADAADPFQSVLDAADTFQSVPDAADSFQSMLDAAESVPDDELEAEPQPSDSVNTAQELDDPSTEQTDESESTESTDETEEPDETELTDDEVLEVLSQDDEMSSPVAASTGTAPESAAADSALAATNQSPPPPSIAPKPRPATSKTRAPRDINFKLIAKVLGFVVAALLLVSIGIFAFPFFIDRGPFEVSGRVTYNGKPVPVGKVTFQPDAPPESEIPQVVAEIKDGNYRTKTGEGVVGGMYFAVISGYRSEADANKSAANPDAAALFPTYRERIKLPKEPTTRDFFIPRIPRRKN